MKLIKDDAWSRNKNVFSKKYLPYDVVKINNEENHNFFFINLQQY